MLIGILGYKKSGKDAISDYIIQNYPKEEYVKYSFAQPLKDGVLAFFGWDRSQVTDQSLKEIRDPFFGISPRECLQFFGTEVLREGVGKSYPEFKKVCGSSFWVKKFEKTYQQSPQNFILPDVRFIEEVEAVKKLGGIIIRVDRDSTRPTLKNLGNISWATVVKIWKSYPSQTLKFLLAFLSPLGTPWRSFVEEMLLIEHPSEGIHKLKPDYILSNNGSLEDLYKKVDSLLLAYASAMKFTEEMKAKVSALIVGKYPTQDLIDEVIRSLRESYPQPRFDISVGDGREDKTFRIDVKEIIWDESSKQKWIKNYEILIEDEKE